MDKGDKLFTAILCAIALLLFIAIILYNAGSSPDYARGTAALHQPSLSSTASQPPESVPSAEPAANPEESAETEPSDPAPPEPGSHEELWFDLNTVTLDQLCRINGIGEVKANAILSFRDQIGGFDSLEQLQQVKGIGEKTYQKLTEYLYVE